MSALVLLSGGMDSVTALHHAAKSGRVVAALSFDYGSKHNAREIPFAAWQALALGIRHIILDLPFVDKHFSSDLLKSGDAVPHGHYAESVMKRTVVPFRNAIMISIATGLAESLDADETVIAAHSGDHAVYPDCREDFLQAMDAAMQAGTYARVKLSRPFVDWDKTRILQYGLALGVDFSQTWSCYEGGDIHCGLCGTCVERKEAFTQAGAEDPTVYRA